MLERGQRLQLIQEKMNTVEDEVFGEFCQEIGVDNIRYMVQSIHVLSTSPISTQIPMFLQFVPHLFPIFKIFVGF